MRLYSVSRGTIEIDTVSIDKLDPKYICQNITLLEQNPVIFDDKTIAENIAIAIVDDYDSLQAIPYYLIEQSAHFAFIAGSRFEYESESFDIIWRAAATDFYS